MTSAFNLSAKTEGSAEARSRFILSAIVLRSGPAEICARCAEMPSEATPEQPQHLDEC